MQNTDNKFDNEVQPSTYQVTVVNLAWNPVPVRPYRSKYEAKRELPDQMTFDIPEERILKFKKNPKTFDSEVETYIYNTLTNKFGHELYKCQIYLPLDA